MTISRIFLFLFVLLVSINGIQAQSTQKKLEEKRKKLIKEISQTTQLLKQTRKNKEAALDRFVTLQRQIKKRQQLITTLQSEVELANKIIDRTHLAVAAMNTDIERLHQERALMLRTAYRQKLTNSTLLFLFSASSFNELWRRWRYLRQYHNYRQKQTRLIAETQQTLTLKSETLTQKRAEKQALLQSEEQQTELLAQELTDSDKLLGDLKKDENRLSLNLKKQKKQREGLNKAIEKAILAEIKRKRKRRRTAPAVNAKEARENVAFSDNFLSNKGKMNLPTKGVITKFFGRQPHPTLKGIYVESNGIDIKTKKGAPVKVVCKGEVAEVLFIPGYNYMVMVRHGDYFTVYSNLAELTVKKGDTVKTGTVIGEVNTDRITNTSQLHFEVWKGKKRLNPMRWLRK